MQITIRPDGEIRIDSNGSTPAEIAGTILSIQQELRKQEQARTADRPVSLNDCQGETYDWLVEHDNPRGVHRSAVAQAFNINGDAAGNRLQTLAAMGFARRVGGGRYRAVTE